MGNCLRHESSMQWGGDDWDQVFTSRNTRHERQEKGFKVEERVILENHDNGLVPSSTTLSTEIKIKITKRQLEELLGGVDMKELSAQDDLAQLLNLGVGYETYPRSPWRPNLPSIPE